MEFQLTDLIDGQYKVVEKHRGGMSIVYIVLDAFSQKRFAIKTVREEYLEDRAAVERFCEEAKTWMNIGRHEHVVEAIIYRDLGGQPLLWLEYVDGSDLQKLIEGERHLFSPQVMRYCLQVCDAMAYVHSAPVRGRTGVIHRDLKPANIMIDKRVGAKVTDFGLAKVHGQSPGGADAGTGLGTYLYMPPEQFLDAASADATSDIYSFGACMYAALAGAPPVSGNSVGAVVNSILSSTPRPLVELDLGVPPVLSDIVSKCLSKARDARFASFSTLRDALAAALPQVGEALGGRDVCRCQGCGYASQHPYRVCPVCTGTLDRGPWSELSRTLPAIPAPTVFGAPAPPPPAPAASATPGPETPPQQQAAAPTDAAPEAAPAQGGGSELLTQAIGQRDAGRPRQAMALLRDALNIDPGNTEVRALLDEIALQVARERPQAQTKSYNWTMFRGNPSRVGCTPELVLPPLRRKWQTRIGEWVISSPVVVNGAAYVGAYVDRPGRHGRVVALRMQDGQLLWATDFAHEVLSSPVVLGGRILYVGCQNSLVALDCKTGRRLWEFTTAGEVVSGPGAVQRLVFFGSCDGRLYGIHPQSGQQIWAFRSAGEISSSPAYRNGTIYFGSSDHRLYAVSAETGRVQWEFMSAGEIPGAPAWADERIYVGSTDHRMYCLDAPSGRKIWEHQTESEIHSSPAISGDQVFFGSRDHCVYCLESRTGVLTWRFATGDWVHCSPVVSGNVVYCGSHDKKLYAIESDSGVLLWEYETGGEVQSSPAVSVGSVVVGSNDGHVYCFKGQ